MDKWDQETRSSWVIALAYSASEQESLEREVSLLQDCLDCTLRLERAGGLKSKEKQYHDLLKSFRKALAELAVYRTREKHKRDRAHAELEKTQNGLRLEGFILPDKEC